MYQVGEEHHHSSGGHHVGAVPWHNEEKHVHDQPERKRRPVGSSRRSGISGKSRFQTSRN
jgi:hypothetical protein